MTGGILRSAFNSLSLYSYANDEYPGYPNFADAVFPGKEQWDANPAHPGCVNLGYNFSELQINSPDAVSDTSLQYEAYPDYDSKVPAHYLFSKRRGGSFPYYYYKLAAYYNAFEQPDAYPSFDFNVYPSYATF